MNKTLRPEDLFESSQEESPVLQAEVAPETVAAILNALGVNRDYIPTQLERRAHFIDSLPDNVKEALQTLIRMAGVTTADEMFYSCTPRKMVDMTEAVCRLDLERIWIAYHNA